MNRNEEFITVMAQASRADRAEEVIDILTGIYPSEIIEDSSVLTMVMDILGEIRDGRK